MSRRRKNEERLAYQCGKCGSDSCVVDSRMSTEGYIRRRRKCLMKSCKERWTTVEFRVPTHKRGVTVASGTLLFQALAPGMFKELRTQLIADIEARFS